LLLLLLYTYKLFIDMLFINGDILVNSGGICDCGLESPSLDTKITVLPSDIFALLVFDK
jgi:hypothetical protein